MAEELLHFKQAQGLGIVGKGGFPGPASLYESDARDSLLELGFTPRD